MAVPICSPTNSTQGFPELAFLTWPVTATLSFGATTYKVPMLFCQPLLGAPLLPFKCSKGMSFEKLGQFKFVVFQECKLPIQKASTAVVTIAV